MKVWAVRLWAEGTLLPADQRRGFAPGRFEVDRPAGVPIARLLTTSAVSADPNVFPPLYDVHLVKASGTCMRLRGFEKPTQRRVVFQEWIIDFHPDGQGRFDMTLDAAIGGAQAVDKPRQPASVK